MFSFKADTKEALLLKQAVVHENLAENAFQFSFLQLKEKLHEHKVKVKVKSLSCVQLFATPWTVAYQASLSFTISGSLLKFMQTVFPPFSPLSLTITELY